MSYTNYTLKDLIYILIIVFISLIVIFLAYHSITMETSFSRKAKQKITMADIRSIADLWEKYKEDNGTYLPKNKIIKSSSWGNITSSELQKILVSYRKYHITFKDAWGYELQFRVVCNDDGDCAYFIRSMGKDGMWESDEYRKKIIKSYDDDIVFSNGEFIQRPLLYKE